MKAEIQKAIEAILQELGLNSVDFVVEHPADLSHGDYATNVAMVSAKKLGKNPREVAEQFLVALEGKIQHVAKIDIAGPGFINFHLDRNFFKEKITEITNNPEGWDGEGIILGKERKYLLNTPIPIHLRNFIQGIFSRM